MAFTWVWATQNWLSLEWKHNRYNWQQARPFLSESLCNGNHTLRRTRILAVWAGLAVFLLQCVQGPIEDVKDGNGTLHLCQLLAAPLYGRLRLLQLHVERCPFDGIVRGVAATGAVRALVTDASVAKLMASVLEAAFQPLPTPHRYFARHLHASLIDVPSAVVPITEFLVIGVLLLAWRALGNDLLESSAIPTIGWTIPAHTGCHYFARNRN